MARAIRLFFNRILRSPRWPAFLVIALLLAPPAHADLPVYLREALKGFSADVPQGWAFTIKTQRDETVTTERYDPTKPPSERWTLLSHKGQPPTADDLKRYAELKQANPLPGSQATFKREDIDPASLTLKSEDDDRADYEGAFRETSAESDKMLAHLVLRLTVNKRRPHVEKYTIELREPYSPILGVKMVRLLATMTFVPPKNGEPNRPASFTSDCQGRIFFIGTAEKLAVTYSDYRQAP